MDTESILASSLISDFGPSDILNFPLILDNAILMDAVSSHNQPPQICPSGLSFQSESASIVEDVNDEAKKQNHSEIEKRRRDKMNLYITELSTMIPMCKAMSRKLDKLTVLRMAVQYMKTIRGNMNTFTGEPSSVKPSFLSNDSLKDLILQAAEGFLFVVSCDRGRILFVSESVLQVLNYSQRDLLGQNWFDILHPKDVAKVKEQLSASDLTPKERLIDAKTMLPVKTGLSPSTQTRLCPGSRRSFFCRMKYKSKSHVKEEADTTTGYAQKKRKTHNSDRKYCVIHCMGYLKSWASAKLNLNEESDLENEGCNLSCLVAIGKTISPFNPSSSTQPNISLRSMEFTSRHATDGKFLFVDQRATFILGYLPQELLGTYCYEYCHPDDIQNLADSHRHGMAAKSGPLIRGIDEHISKSYRFKTKSGSFICLKTIWRAFRNPWTKEIEYLVALNSCVPDEASVESSNVEYLSAGYSTPSSEKNALDTMLSNIGTLSPTNSNKSVNSGSSYSSASESNVQKVLSNSRVGLWKIGRQIADEAMELQRKSDDSSCQSSSSLSSVASNECPVSLFENLGLQTLNKNINANIKFTNPNGKSGTLPQEAPTSLNIKSSTPTGPTIVQDTKIVPLSSDFIMTSTTDPLMPNNGSTNSIVNISSGNFIIRHNNSNNIVTNEEVNPKEVPAEIQNASAQNDINEENDEAAMSLIMSILEADAGLGGPVDFSGLPWPLF